MQEPKTKEIESIVEAVIENTFNVVKSAYDFQKESSHASSRSAQEVGTRIIFPKYRDGSCRISEQELRFVFVEQLNKYLDEKGISGIYYSVETPTEHSYSMKEKSVDEENGRSGNTDLTIHNDKFKRVCIIEFKILNPDKDDYAKDILKLKNEDCPLKYFIQIVKNANDKTIDNLREVKTADMRDRESTIHYRCYCLDNGKRLTEVELN